MNEQHGLSLPTQHQIRAALSVLEALPVQATPIAKARAEYAAAANGGVLSEDDMVRAEKMLVAAGLLVVHGEDVQANSDTAVVRRMDITTAAGVIIVRLLERRPPIWLPTAAGGQEVKPELIPDEDLAILDRFLVGPGFPRDPVLLAASRRWEERHLATLAQVGLAHVENACRQELVQAGDPAAAAAVMRIDDASPALGCNVLAPVHGGGTRRLLVRTTRRLSWRRPILVTRSELSIGRADPSWALVVCEVPESGTAKLIGWCRASELDKMVPDEPHPHGRWMVMSVLAVELLLTPGLPPG